MSISMHSSPMTPTRVDAGKYRASYIRTEGKKSDRNKPVCTHARFACLGWRLEKVLGMQLSWLARVHSEGVCIYRPGEVSASSVIRYAETGSMLRRPIVFAPAESSSVIALLSPLALIHRPTRWSRSGIWDYICALFLRRLRLSRPSTFPPFYEIQCFFVRTKWEHIGFLLLKHHSFSPFSLCLHSSLFHTCLLDIPLNHSCLLLYHINVRSICSNTFLHLISKLFTW